MRLVRSVLLSLCIVPLCAVQSVFAHTLPDSLVTLNVQQHKVQTSLQLPLADLLLAFPQTLTENGEVNTEALSGYLTSHIAMYTDPEEPWSLSIQDISDSTVDDANGGYQSIAVQAIFIPDTEVTPRQFTLDDRIIISEVTNHKILISVAQDWLRGTSAQTQVGAIEYGVFDESIPSLTVQLGESGIWNSFITTALLGMEHILGGTDHVLFLLSLLLVAPLLAAGRQWSGYKDMRDMLQSVLSITIAFTIGHSITLLIGAFIPGTIPQQPIESLIAVTIMISAVHALRPLFPDREAMVAGGFGLIHGLAFSYTLHALQLTGSAFAMSLFGFNLGIELMQLIIVALTIPVLMLLMKTGWYRVIRVSAAALILIVSTVWLIERLV